MIAIRYFLRCKSSALFFWFRTVLWIVIIIIIIIIIILIIKYRYLCNYTSHLYSSFLFDIALRTG